MLKAVIRAGRGSNVFRTVLDEASLKLEGPWHRAQEIQAVATDFHLG